MATETIRLVQDIPGLSTLPSNAKVTIEKIGSVYTLDVFDHNDRPAREYSFNQRDGTLEEMLIDLGKSPTWVGVRSPGHYFERSGAGAVGGSLIADINPVKEEIKRGYDLIFLVEYAMVEHQKNHGTSYASWMPSAIKTIKDARDSFFYDHGKIDNKIPKTPADIAAEKKRSNQNSLFGTPQTNPNTQAQLPVPWPRIGQSQQGQNMGRPSTGVPTWSTIAHTHFNWQRVFNSKDFSRYEAFNTYSNADFRAQIVVGDSPRSNPPGYCIKSTLAYKARPNDELYKAEDHIPYVTEQKLLAYVRDIDNILHNKASWHGRNP
jgi:hypothetical protein